MSRLTDFNNTEIVPNIISHISDIVKKQDEYIMNQIIELQIDPNILENQLKEIHRLNKELKEYIDLEEQGRLVKLPCKVGDRVYEVTDVYIYPYKVQDISLKAIKYADDWIDRNEIGETVFFTREEAEAKLKEGKE